MSTGLGVGARVLGLPLLLTNCPTSDKSLATLCLSFPIHTMGIEFKSPKRPSQV